MIEFDDSLYYYDSAAAENVIEFIETLCKHIRGDKAGINLKLTEFWKEDIIRPAFGIKRKSNGRRRFKTVYVEIGKGNAKSTVGSALALYLLGFDTTKGAEVYSVAGDREQARIIFDTARFMIQEEEALQTIFQPYQYSITTRKGAGFYKVVSAEASTKHGFNPSGIIFDELHVQPTRELWDTLTAGQMKRDESITFAFTTAGWDKQSICYELHKKAVQVNRGIIKDDSFLGVIYTAPLKADISSPETWAMANPGLGTIISIENMQIEYNKVVASQAYENTFRRLHLNQWTDSYEAWISDDEYMKCEESYSEDDLDGMLCYGGLDLAATRDFNSLALTFESGRTLQYYWIPEDMVDRRVERQTIDLRTWIDSGLIRVTPGSSVDYEIILRDILALVNKFDIKSIAYDRRFSGALVSRLESEVKMTPFDQSISSISFPTKQFDVLIGNRKMKHNGNPVTRWMLSNVAIYRDANDNIKVTKHKSTEKVDGIVAWIMSLGEKLTYEINPEFKSIYEKRGVLEI